MTDMQLRGPEPLLQSRRARDTIFIVQGAIDEVFGGQCSAKQVFKTMDAEHPGLSELVGLHFPAIDYTLPELSAEPIILSDLGGIHSALAAIKTAYRSCAR
jgi:hypothetical protein